MTKEPQGRYNGSMTEYTDYRDRISVLVAMVLLGLTAERLISLPTRIVQGIVLGSPLSLGLNTATILSALLAGLTAFGTEGVIRAHPRALSEELTHTWVFWALPCALVVVATQLLPLAPSRLYWLLGLITTAILLALAEAAAYRTIDPTAPGARRSRGFLNLLTYGLAVLLFVVVYQSRTRSLISGTWNLIVGFMLTLEILRESGRPVGQILPYAIASGLVLGEATWALNYWRGATLSAGLLLLVGFYLMSGMAHQFIQGRLNRWVLAEFGAVAVLVLLLIGLLGVP